MGQNHQTCSVQAYRVEEEELDEREGQMVHRYIPCGRWMDHCTCAADGIQAMWVPFTVQGTLDNMLFPQYEVDDAENLDLCKHRNVVALLRFVAKKMKFDAAILLSKVTFEVNMSIPGFGKQVRNCLPVQPHS